jgi:ribose/xylose/arabinose/galactoside ABC-type transport system permease subunit
MSTLTAYLSRLIGLFFILVALCMVAHRQSTGETLTALTHNPPLLFTLGMVFLATGLAIVLSHNVWSGGALPVIVTIVGWVTLLRGLMLLSLAPDTLAWLLQTVHFDRLFYLYIAVTLALGAYLTYGGFRPTPASGKNLHA